MICSLLFTSEIFQTNPVMLAYVQVSNHLPKQVSSHPSYSSHLNDRKSYQDPILPTCLLSHSSSIHHALICQAPCLMLVMIRTNQMHSLQFGDLISYQSSSLVFIQSFFPSMLPSVFTPSEIHSECLLPLNTLSLDICVVISLISIKSFLKCHLL